MEKRNSMCKNINFTGSTKTNEESNFEYGDIGSVFVVRSYFEVVLSNTSSC